MTNRSSNSSSIATQSSSSGSSTLYAYRHIQGIIYQVLELLGCESTHGVQQKRKVKKNGTRKNGLSGIWNVDLKCKGTESYLPNHPVSSQDYTQTDMYLYVGRDTWSRNEQFLKKRKQHSSRRETMWARPRPPPAESGYVSKVRHDKQTAHRMMVLISRS